MRALTILPGAANSARVDDVPEPPASDGPILVRALALGVCGTDREIVAGEYGWAPPGQERLILGHESFGQVEEAPKDCGLEPGDWKPMSSIGPGVCEIRVRNPEGAFRAVYLANTPLRIYVLHCFQKKSRKTARQDIETAIRRLKSIPR